MRRAIQDLLEDPLATGILDGRFNPGDTVSATRRGDALQLAVIQSTSLESTVEEASISEAAAPVAPAE
jgi:ATP-dependent Clp protease ATP-binding subunit ClpA